MLFAELITFNSSFPAHCHTQAEKEQMLTQSISLPWSASQELRLCLRSLWGSQSLRPLWRRLALEVRRHTVDPQAQVQGPQQICSTTEISWRKEDLKSPKLEQNGNILPGSPKKLAFLPWKRTALLRCAAPLCPKPCSEMPGKHL